MPSIPLLLGHRGNRVSRGVRENTLAAFELAATHGCDGFEFDVRQTADRKLVVCHDPVLGGRSIAKSKYQDLPGQEKTPEKKQADLSKLPCLEDVLLKYGQRVFLDIELKVKGMEHDVLTALREIPPGREYVVTSFLPDVLVELKARAQIPIGLICDQKKQLARWTSLPVDYVVPSDGLVTRSLVEEIHGAQRKVVVWTVNQPRRMRKLAEWGVDGIISDDTRLLVKTLRPA